MGDVDDMQPLAAKFAQTVEDDLRLGLGQRRGRFVQDQQLHVRAAQRLRHLDELAHRERQRSHLGIRVDLRRAEQRVQQRRHARTLRAAPHKAPVVISSPRNMFSVTVSDGIRLMFW